MPRILAFAGSARRESFNKRLVTVAAEIARERGAEVTLIDLNDFPMPLYHGDLEAADGVPAPAQRLYDLMKSHDGLLLACPEYNGSITPLLKNTLDWVSRRREGDPPLAAYTGKVAGLLAASPGQGGGLRGLVHVRAILGNLGVLVLPGQVAVPAAADAFNDSGDLRDPGVQKRVMGVVEELVRVTGRLATHD
ncbi:MAG: NAD(P)H-dependent oxidoreductase [Planctomycetaceae bacterium]